MRQGQQNRRNRGRSRNRTSNPLTRNYESNGPDVKIKGTAAHIAEKYLALARDSLSSGNTVTAENYFQHAEHYNRIIMAAQAKQDEVTSQQSTNNRGHRNEDRSDDNINEEDGGEFSEDEEIPGFGEQPVVTVDSVVPLSEDAPKHKPARQRRPKPAKPEPAEADARDGEGNNAVA